MIQSEHFCFPSSQRPWIIPIRSHQITSNLGWPFSTGKRYLLVSESLYLADSFLMWISISADFLEGTLDYIYFSGDTLAKMLRNSLRFVEEMLSRCYCSSSWFLTILCCIVGSPRLSCRCSTKAQYASKHRAGQCKNASHRECALRWRVIWWAVTTEMEAWLSDYMTADTEYLWGGFHKNFSDVLFEPPVSVFWNMTRDYCWVTITLFFVPFWIQI